MNTILHPQMSVRNALKHIGMLNINPRTSTNEEPVKQPKTDVSLWSDEEQSALGKDFAEAYVKVLDTDRLHIFLRKLVLQLKDPKFADCHEMICKLLLNTIDFAHVGGAGGADHRRGGG